MKNIWIAATLVFAVSAARAEDAPKKKWKDSAELSLVSTTGNSFTQTTSGKNTFNYDWSRAGLELFGAGLGAKSEGRVTAEEYNAGEKISWKATERNYLFERFKWTKNRFAGIRNRYETTAGAGRQVLKLDRHSAFLELGFGHTSEERIGSEAVKFASGRVYTKYALKISDTSNFSQDFEYLHNFDDPRDYRHNAETALTAAVSSTFSIKLSYLWNRVGRPPLGFTRDDTKTAVSLLANF
jgi:putative salt-induced outer membrane protein YdiY